MRCEPIVLNDPRCEVMEHHLDGRALALVGEPLGFGLVNGGREVPAKQPLRVTILLLSLDVSLLQL